MSIATEQVYTLADLENWPPEKAQFPANGVALAVIGHPVAHSLSPAMHNAAIARLAETKPGFTNWRYYKFEVPPEKLGSAIELFRKKNFRGLNLTVPHKMLAMEFVDAAPIAKDIGAANTLKPESNRWRGYNTDGYGLAEALKHDLAVSLNGADIILLGAGGASRAAAVKCLWEQCRSLWIGNRTPASALSLIKDLKAAPGKDSANIRDFSLENPGGLPANAIVINATSLGLKPNDPSPLDLTKIPKPRAVFDMIYRPAQTALLRLATELGIPNANGLSMLVYQGAESLSIWTGEMAPVEVMDKAVRAVLK